MKTSTLGLTVTGIRWADTITGTGATGRARRTPAPSGWSRAMTVAVTTAATGVDPPAVLSTTITGTMGGAPTGTPGAKTTITTTTGKPKGGTKKTAAIT